MDFPKLPVDEIDARSISMEQSIAGDGCSLTFVPYNFLIHELQRKSPMEKEHPFIVWDKRTVGLGWTIRRCYEFIILRTNPHWRAKWPLPSVIPYPRTDYRYQTSKPIGLLSTLLDSHATSKHLVFDAYPGGDGAKVATIGLGLEYRAGVKITTPKKQDKQDRLF